MVEYVVCMKMDKIHVLEVCVCGRDLQEQAVWVCVLCCIVLCCVLVVVVMHGKYGNP